MPYIKICGLCRPEDAALAAEAGATHCGVIRVPGTARWRSLTVAREVLDGGRGLRRVGVFADSEAAVILGEAESLGLDVIQLHGEEAPEVVAALQAEGLEVWKVAKPTSPESLIEAADRYAGADVLLLEGASPRGMGGVGARFDWESAAAVLDRLPAGTRLGVAGGLTPENVATAMSLLAPWVVDVSSGVERAVGEKDEEKVRAFVTRARAHT